MFPDKTSAKLGSFKTCLIGILGVSGQNLCALKTQIHAHDSTLQATDILTTIELGFDMNESINEIRENRAKVLVVSDPWRPALEGQQGTIMDRNISSRSMNKSIQVRMNRVNESQIRLIPGKTKATIKWPGDPLDGTECITRENGGELDGWCSVKLLQEHQEGRKIVRVPSKYLEHEPVHFSVRRSDKWDWPAIVWIMRTDMVPVPDTPGGITFQGDGSVDQTENIKLFDPSNTLTPKIFTTFYKHMKDWDDQGQKNALAESICREHDDIFLNDKLQPRDSVYFAWETRGVQSVFEGSLAFEARTPRDIFHYVTMKHDTSGNIRLGKTQCHPELHTAPHVYVVYWEDASVGEPTSPSDLVFIDALCRENFHFVAVGSRVVRKYCADQVGTVVTLSKDGINCTIDWDTKPFSHGQEDPLDSIQRLFLTRVVSIHPGLSAYVENSPYDDFTLLNFYGTVHGDKIGRVWVSTGLLNKDNIRQKVLSYVHFPRRSARFSVQERAGESIRSIVSRKRPKMRMSSPEMCIDLVRAIATFMRGVGKMHSTGFIHNDAHSGNITLDGPCSRGKFRIRLIDFDRLERDPNTSDDFHSVSDGISDLLGKIDRTINKDSNVYIEQAAQTIRDRGNYVHDSSGGLDSTATFENLAIIFDRICER